MTSPLFVLLNQTIRHQGASYAIRNGLAELVTRMQCRILEWILESEANNSWLWVSKQIARLTSKCETKNGQLSCTQFTTKEKIDNHTIVESKQALKNVTCADLFSSLTTLTFDLWPFVHSTPSRIRSRILHECQIWLPTFIRVILWKVRYEKTYVYRETEGSQRLYPSPLPWCRWVTWSMAD